MHGSSTRGYKKGESIELAMYRELKEETGIGNADVEILGRTKTWHYYDVPKNLIKKENRSFYKGQRQIWFLLRFNGLDTNIIFRDQESLSLTRGNGLNFPKLPTW